MPAPREVVRTYLELPAPDALRRREWPAEPATRLRRAAPCGVAEYRTLYQAVGEPWAWRDRNAWPDARLADWLARPGVEVWVLEWRPAPDAPWALAGYHELHRDDAGDVELVYFGLVEAAHGRGLGGALLTHAVERALAIGTGRVWLHTCTLDGPAALPNYRARGFVPTRTETYHTDA